MTDARRIAGHEPAFHRFLIGQREAAVVSDGPLSLTPAGEVFATLAPDLIERALRDVFQTAGPMRIEQNCLLVDLDGQLVLFDNGMGTSQLFGSQAGRLVKSLGEAGVRPEEIDAMVLSHAHPDHCWGTMRDDGTPTFLNAAIYMAKEELLFWKAAPIRRWRRWSRAWPSIWRRCGTASVSFATARNSCRGCARSRPPATRRAIRFLSFHRVKNSSACSAMSRSTTRSPMPFPRARARMTMTRLLARVRGSKSWHGSPTCACG